MEILPFRGLRYNPQKISGMGQVIAPPYDVIKDEQRVALERQHAHNVIRLILGQPYERDTEVDNQYSRSAGNIEKLDLGANFDTRCVAELLRLRSIVHHA